MTTALPSTVVAGRRIHNLEARLTTARAERDEAIVARWQDGVGGGQIAREVGLTRQAVYNILAAYDIDTARVHRVDKVG